MISLFITAILLFNYFVWFYYGFVNLIYTGLLCIALVVVLRHIRRIRYAPLRELLYSSEMPPVSILIPAFNEGDIVIRTVRSAMEMDYPFFDVIVLNDGSDDHTLEQLIDAYKLKKIDLVYREFIKTEAVRGFYYNREIPNLLVVDKARGGKPDALNCGINISQNPYFCSIDADTIVEPQALLRLMSSVVASSKPVVACGGVVRVMNGVKLRGAFIERIGLPKSFLANFQIVEYLRGFLFGRVGLDFLNATLILSGAFSLFQKSAVLAVGGYACDIVCEDMELVVRLHRHYRKEKLPYLINFVTDPICWTEVPEKIRTLAKQRRRWHLGLLQSIVRHRGVLFNPRYGSLGLSVMPYYLFVEAFSPLVEILGYIAVIGAYVFGLINYEFFVLFLILAVFYGIFLSVAGVFLEEITYRRYPGWEHLFLLLVFGVLENFGYRQMNSFWRVQAFFQFLIGWRKWELSREQPKKGARQRAQ